MIRARDHVEIEDGRNNVNRVTGTGTGIVTSNQNGPSFNKPVWTHKVCGKAHQWGKCGYKCTTCDKPHKEEDCWTLHPEKAPRNLGKSPSKTDKSRGRDRSKDQQRWKNNKSNSGERGGDRDKPRERGQSPREMTGRVTEEDNERELARLIQQIEGLQTGNNVKRVRKELFEDNRREEENYREDERNWLRNERNNGQRRMRRIRIGNVPPSKQHLRVVG